MWLFLLAILAAVFVASILKRSVRSAIGWTVAALGALLVLVIVTDVARIMHGSYQYQRRINRVAPG